MTDPTMCNCGHPSAAHSPTYGFCKRAGCGCPCWRPDEHDWHIPNPEPKDAA